MSHKTCVVCGESKILNDFHRAGRKPSGTQTYRNKCKRCCKAKSRVDKQNIAAGLAPPRPVRRGSKYLPMPVESRLKGYRDAIDRMNRLGLMSDEYARDAHKRVNNLVKSGI